MRRRSWQWFCIRFLPLSEYSFGPLRCHLLSLGSDMQRRKFITLLGGAAAAWPLSVGAQQPARMRRVGMLVGFNDPDIKAFQQELERRGWKEGSNIHIDYRVAPAGAQAQTLAKELVALQPDVIFALTRPVTAALQKETNKIPIVFTS